MVRSRQCKPEPAPLTRAGLAEASKLSTAFVQLLGTVFMGLQGLASTGIITINWERTTELFGQYVDVNGDGKVDKADAEHAIKELQVRAFLRNTHHTLGLCILRCLDLTRFLRGRFARNVVGTADKRHGPGSRWIWHRLPARPEIWLTRNSETVRATMDGAMHHTFTCATCEFDLE